MMDCFNPTPKAALTVFQWMDQGEDDFVFYQEMGWMLEANKGNPHMDAIYEHRPWLSPSRRKMLDAHPSSRPAQEELSFPDEKLWLPDSEIDLQK